MKSPVLVGLAWVATVTLAFLLGSQMRPRAAARDDRRPAAADPGATASGAAPHPLPPETRVAEATGTAPAAATAVAPEPPEDVKPVVVRPGMLPQDISTLLMRYAAAKLAQGPEGQKELFREFDRLMRDKQARQMLRDENQVMPLLYPWMRFLMDHDRQVVAMMETLYRTAAEDPQWFQGLDDDSFEVFAEGFAMLLPGVADAEQLARFRAYAEKIVAMPRDSLPEALAKNLSDIQRDLEWWSPAVAPEDLARTLNEPGTPVATKIGLLRRANPDSLRGVDVTAIVAGAIREGNKQAITLPMRFLDSVVIPTLDAAFLDAVAAERLEWHQVPSYAYATERSSWDTLRPFLETGLARGGKATEAFAQSLVFFPKQAPKEFVSTVVATYALPDPVKNQLRKQYGIE